jgi:hypothetical protein
MVISDNKLNIMRKSHENSQGVATLHIHCLLEESCSVENVIGGCSRTGFSIASDNSLKILFLFCFKNRRNKSQIVIKGAGSR